MPNPYFQFKRFRIDQGQCAMKVTTEACLFGAWVHTDEAQDILDIGSGTGLLSLMLAQRCAAQIDAVEIDHAASRQAHDNFSKSPWADRLSIHRDDIQAFAKESVKRYDLIISNPPFFAGSLHSGDGLKNKAFHQSEDGLTAETLARSIAQLISNDGKAYVLYPPHEQQQFIEECQKNGLDAEVALEIYNQPDGNIFRMVSRVQRTSFPSATQQISIRRGNEHTREFEEILQPYYLKL